MKITFATTVICDGFEFSGKPGKFIGPLEQGKTSVEWTTKVDRFIQAAEAEPQALGNRSRDFTLAVGIEFATVEEATTSRLTFDGTLPDEGDLVLEDTGGQKFTYGGATLSRLEIAQTGVYLALDYVFLTRRPATTKTGN